MDEDMDGKTRKNKTSAISQKNQSTRNHSRSRSPHPTKNSRKWISSNAFINFVQDFRKNYIGTKSTRILQIAGERWRKMSLEEKHPYLKAAASIKNRKKTEEKIKNIYKLNTDPRGQNNDDTDKHKEGSRKESKKREPRKTKHKKHESNSDCDSVTSVATASNTSDDLSDDTS